MASRASSMVQSSGTGAADRTQIGSVRSFSLSEDGNKMSTGRDINCAANRSGEELFEWR
jgi:hypothetical protein